MSALASGLPPDASLGPVLLAAMMRGRGRQRPGCFAAAALWRARMGVPQSRRPKRCRPLRGRRLRRGQRGEQIVGGLRRALCAHIPGTASASLAAAAMAPKTRASGIVPSPRQAGPTNAMPERTQFFRFAVRHVIGKRNFAAEAHAACARRLGAGRAAGVGVSVPRRAWPHVTTHPQVGRMRANWRRSARASCSCSHRCGWGGRFSRLATSRSRIGRHEPHRLAQHQVY